LFPFNFFRKKLKKSTYGVVRNIEFPYRQAQLLLVPVDQNPEAILDKLELPPINSLIVLSGGAGGMADTIRPQLSEIFRNGIAPIGAEMQAGFIDGGTDSGVMAMLGQGLANCNYKTPIMGVAPEGVVSYPGKVSKYQGGEHELTPLEPNHSHLVLVDSSDWGAEINVMYGLAGILAKKLPSITLLVNGGPLSRSEVLRSIRLGLPVIIMEGSGRLADDLAALYHKTPRRISNPVLNEIIRFGDLHLCPVATALDDSLDSLRTLLNSR